MCNQATYDADESDNDNQKKQELKIPRTEQIMVRFNTIPILVSQIDGCCNPVN
jgi:hypothetical protein